MEKSRILPAIVRNNALWCNLIASTHASAGRFTESFWMSDGEVPPFYPNLITLKEDPHRAVLFATASHLKQQRVSGAFGIKDSFANVDFGEIGLAPLFESFWVVNHEPANPALNSARGIEWKTARNEDDLRGWASAWSTAAGENPELGLRLFKPELLSKPELRFLLGFEGGKLAAGAALFDGAGVTGVSNVFAPGADESEVWRGLRGEAWRMSPGKPIVGYERDGSLAAARKAGFETLGKLRVWTKK